MNSLRYIIFMPKWTDPNGKEPPWLAVDFGRSRRKDCVARFCPVPERWKDLRKAGWSIVRVEVTA